MSAKREDMLCSNCCWYLANKPTQGTGGECHRHPPQMIAREVVTTGDRETGFARHIESADANWPLVGGDDWCGEWRPK